MEYLYFERLRDGPVGVVFWGSIQYANLRKDPIFVVSLYPWQLRSSFQNLNTLLFWQCAVIMLIAWMPLLNAGERDHDPNEVDKCSLSGKFRMIVWLSGLIAVVSFGLGFVVGFRSRLHQWLHAAIDGMPESVIGQAVAYDRVRAVISRPGATLTDVVELIEREGDRFEAIGREHGEDISGSD